SRIAVVLLAVVTAACAHAPVRPAARPAAASVPAFSFADDTFAFRNDIRAHHADADDLYANYCFVLARGMRQFHQFARFEPAAPRLVQLLVTNWPKQELNHTVVAYGYRGVDDGVEVSVWDPNDPAGPGAVLFDARRERFVASRVYDTRVGPIRVFRMYYSWLL